MTAIQRWYVWADGGAPNTEEVPKSDLTLTPIEQQWCRAEDVAQLEELMVSRANTQSLIATALRTKAAFLEDQLAIKQNEIARLRAAYDELSRMLELRESTDACSPQT